MGCEFPMLYSGSRPLSNLRMELSCDGRGSETDRAREISTVGNKVIILARPEGEIRVSRTFSYVVEDLDR